jgi:hypothetical protein
MRKFVLFILLVQIAVSCKVSYSFIGTSIDVDVNSISVYTIENRAIRINPSLSNSLTEALKDKYRRYTKLQQLVDGGDLMVEGEITSYEVTTTGVTSNEVASQNRLTVTVKIIFTDNKHPENSFEKNFVAYKDFPATASLDTEEPILISTIIENLVEDIFNGTVANW